MKLSIVIPVYCVEDTLEKCVNSVCNQGLTDYELILVDDGSSDNSGKICDILAKTDDKIKVIHKNNGGLSDARNYGIDIAVGEYITFVDSDDFIAYGTLGQLMKIVDEHSEYDILEYPVFVHYGAINSNKLLLEQRVYTNMKEYWLSGKVYAHSYAWNKIYRRSIFDNVRFPVGKIFEDIYTLPLLLTHVNIVATVDVGMYYYCWNPNGITAKADGTALNDLLSVHVGIINKFDKHDINTVDFIVYFIHVLNIQCDVLRTIDTNISVPNLKFNFIPLFCGLIRLKAVKSAFKFFIYFIFGFKGLLSFNKLLHNYLFANKFK